MMMKFFSNKLRIVRFFKTVSSFASCNFGPVFVKISWVSVPFLKARVSSPAFLIKIPKVFNRCVKEKVVMFTRRTFKNLENSNIQITSARTILVNNMAFLS